MRAAALVLAALALLAACGDGDGGEGIVFEDPRGTIDVERGMRFTLEVTVNAGVGFDWEPVGTPDGPVELEETKVDYPDERRDGDSGKKRFVYRATDSGRATIVLRRLYRGDPQERRAIAVNVRG